MDSLCVEDGKVLVPGMNVRDADVLIDRDTGTIKDVGANLEGEETLDAAGGLVIPGLINAHTHVAMTLFRGYADDKPVDRWLEDDIWPAEAELTPDDIAIGAELGILEMIKSGTTTFCDMYFEMDRIAEVATQTGVRARLGYGMITAGKDPSEARDELEAGLATAKQLSGRADGRISAGVMPHSLTTVDLDALEEILADVRAGEYPIHFHANESPAFVDPIREAEGMPPLKYADEHGLMQEGDFVAHGVHLAEEEIELLAERDVGVVHCPGSNMKLASGMAPVQRLHDAGVSVGLGTDGAASNNDLDMFDELRDAALLGKLAADDPRAVPAETAVQMATAHGADILGLPTGRIAEGRPADLAVIDLSAPRLHPHNDLVSHLAYAASGADVRHTLCDGQVLMQDRTCRTIDEDRVIAEASEAAANVVARVAD